MPSFVQIIGVLPETLFILPFAGMFFGTLLIALFLLLGKVMYNHMARQTMQCVLACAALGALLLVVYPWLGPLPRLVENSQKLFIRWELSYLPYILAAFTALCGLHAGVCLLLWNKTRATPAIQFILALFGLILSLLLCLLFFAFTQFLAIPFVHNLFQMIFDFTGIVSMTTDVPAVLLAAALLAGTFCLAVSLLNCWLLIRRNRDDFGRDYYNFALTRYCLAGCLAALAALAGLGFSAFMRQTLLLDGALSLKLLSAAAGLLAFSLVIWLATARSQAPLRYKPGLWLTLPMVILSVAMQLLLSYQYLSLHAPAQSTQG